jgi:hypothetical protein
MWSNSYSNQRSPGCDALSLTEIKPYLQGKHFFVSASTYQNRRRFDPIHSVSGTPGDECLKDFEVGGGLDGEKLGWAFKALLLRSLVDRSIAVAGPGDPKQAFLVPALSQGKRLNLW